MLTPSCLFRSKEASLMMKKEKARKVSIEDEFKGPSNDNRLKTTGLGDGLINFQAEGGVMGRDLVLEEGQFRSPIEGVCEKMKQHNP
ncbi:hypothetical protein QYF36_021276 [Acer negundo]|nr:hypothetical protein QYF36_021276 [Acer negundo]